MIYLASPYSHPDPEVRKQRFHEVCRIAAELIQQGEVVFCPIAHSHPLEVHGGLQGGWDFWAGQDIPFMERCDVMLVACLPGWETSEGVRAEVAWWKKHKNTPVEFITEGGNVTWPTPTL